MAATCQAMQQILQLHLPGNLAADNRHLRAENARLEAHNARLQADVRQLQAAVTSPYGNHFHTQDPRHRLVTWREFGEERDEVALKLVAKIEPAMNILRNALRDTCTLVRTPAWTSELARVHNAVCDAVQVLAEESDEEQSDEEESDEEEDEEEEQP